MHIIARTCKCAHAQMDARANARTRKRTHAGANARTRKGTHARANACTRKHTHAQMQCAYTCTRARLDTVFICVLASLQLGLSVGPSVRWLVDDAFVKNKENHYFQANNCRRSSGGTQDESHVITSSYNHFIIMRTHRWPYGPCLNSRPGLMKALVR